jgi:hypothetical protein
VPSRCSTRGRRRGKDGSATGILHVCCPEEGRSVGGRWIETKMTTTKGRRREEKYFNSVFIAAI